MADERDPLDVLRASNPHPSPRDPDRREAQRASALAEEILMSPNDRSATTSRTAHGARRIAVLGGATAAAALVVAIVISTRDNGSTTTTTESTVSTPTALDGPIGAASCVEQYSLATLANRSLAFDGTVETADVSTVTFRVSRWFRGGEGDTVTLESNGLAGGVVSSNSGGLTLEVGGRYLVAGEPPFVWGCGFTQPYQPSTAAEWATAFQP
jgi:hypothetical protein